MKIALCALTVATLLALGCSDVIPATQVMVVIEAEAAVRAQTHDVRLVVRSGQGETSKWEARYEKTLALGDAGVRWPLEFALVPKSSDATRVYEVVATAIDNHGAAIAVVRAISGYLEHRALKLTLNFEDSCIGKALLCDDTETCVHGGCADAHVKGTSLPGYAPGEGSNAGSSAVGIGDSGSTNLDASRDSDRPSPDDASTPDAAISPNVDAAVVGFDAAVSDAAVAEPDAAVPELASTCEPCSVTADCAPNHACLYKQSARSCLPQFPAGSMNCSTFGEDLKAYGDSITWYCIPISPANRTCADWLAEWGAP